MVDEESSLNGGWNEQNCFTGLRRFLESNNLPTEVDYKYEAFRSDDNPQEMEHIVHAEIEIPSLDRDLFPDGELRGGGEGNSMEAAKNASTLGCTTSEELDKFKQSEIDLIGIHNTLLTTQDTLNKLNLTLEELNAKLFRSRKNSKIITDKQMTVSSNIVNSEAETSETVKGIIESTGENKSTDVKATSTDSIGPKDSASTMIDDYVNHPNIGETANQIALKLYDLSFQLSDLTNYGIEFGIELNDQSKILDHAQAFKFTEQKQNESNVDEQRLDRQLQSNLRRSNRLMNYVCAFCKTYLANENQIASTLFNTVDGQAYLFSGTVANLIVGKDDEDLNLFSGVHTDQIRCASCMSCEKKLGWMCYFASRGIGQTNDEVYVQTLLKRKFIEPIEGSEEMMLRIDSTNSRIRFFGDLEQRQFYPQYFHMSLPPEKFEKLKKIEDKMRVLNEEIKTDMEEMRKARLDRNRDNALRNLDNLSNKFGICKRIPVIGCIIEFFSG